MTRPADVPEDVWSAAVAVMGHPGRETALAIARAILTERERCASLVSNWNDKRNGHLSDHLRTTVASYIRAGAAR